MSMLSLQIDELRQMADGGATHRDLREVMLRAADTIWELRDDLQRANAATQDAEHDESMAWDRVRKAEAENARLRELVRALLTCATDGECDECRMNGATPWHVGEVQLCDGVWEHLRELGIGIEVDE